MVGATLESSDNFSLRYNACNKIKNVFLYILYQNTSRSLETKGLRGYH
jgi:hypothetical protein